MLKGNWDVKVIKREKGMVCPWGRQFMFWGFFYNVYDQEPHYKRTKGLCTTTIQLYLRGGERGTHINRYSHMCTHMYSGNAWRIGKVDHHQEEGMGGLGHVPSSLPGRRNSDRGPPSFLSSAKSCISSSPLPPTLIGSSNKHQLPVCPQRK